MHIKLRKLHPDAVVPTYGSRGAAAFDLYSIEPLALFPGERAAIDTGVAFEIPDGHVLLIYARSGLAQKHGVHLANSVGVIDSDYRGPVIVTLANSSPYVVDLPPHSRIAQGMIVPVDRVTFDLADQLSATERGTGGHGSTGV